MIRKKSKKQNSFSVQIVQTMLSWFCLILGIIGLVVVPETYLDTPLQRPYLSVYIFLVILGGILNPQIHRLIQFVSSASIGITFTRSSIFYILGLLLILVGVLV